MFSVNAQAIVVIKKCRKINIEQSDLFDFVLLSFNNMTVQLQKTLIKRPSKLSYHQKPN